MRLDVKKYLFMGHHKALQSFFEKAQECALVHFIDTSHLKAKEIPSDIQDITNSIKVVRELPTLNQEEPESYSEVDHITKKILDLKHSIDQLEEERRMMRLEIGRIDVFGQFSFDDIAYIEKEGKIKIQFFFAKKGIKEEIKLPEELIYVNTEYGLDYFVAFNKEPAQYENMIEMHIEHEYNSLRQRFSEIEAEIKKKVKELKVYAKYNTFLHNALIQKYNGFNLETAKNYAREKVDGQIFAVEGWAPVHKRFELEKMLEHLDVQVVEIAIDEDEVAPTYLENTGFNRIGEDLVHVYDTPANTDKDPSSWVLFSFAVFFAMIINDGGYGLVFLAAALYFKFKNPDLRKTGMRIWKLAVILCSFCVVWGVLTNSFFGLSLGPESGIRKVSALNWLVEKKAEYHFSKKDEVYKDWAEKYPEVKNARNAEQFLKAAKKESNGNETYEMVNKFSDGILMELALLVGVIHICLSFMRYIRRNLAGAGWILAILGCYLYLPLFLNATSMVHYVAGMDRALIAQDGLYLIYIGLGLALTLSLIQNKLFGLLEITNVIQIFADVLSYLRLYALGLAGSIISATVNDIAGSLFFLGGGLLLLFGHGLNMVLSIIGGIIHGLRLNFIEWYHYCFEGGGKIFDPLRKIEIE